jgi:KipI family sensor histidine kinase inhibitor
MSGGTLPSRCMQPKVTPAGDRGLMADFGPSVNAGELHRRASALRAQPGVVACIVGQQSLYIVLDGPRTLEWDEVPHAELAAGAHVIDVDFAGADLEAFLAHAHITRDDLLASLPTLRLSARYLGFRAGFAYLEGWPDAWQMPRRTTSRNVVPRGSFAIAGTMAGFYPVDSPGGWNLLGRTNATLWDPDASPPNRFAPGDVIELRATSISSFDAPTVRAHESEGDVVASVIAPGQLTSIVGARDWRRADHGVSPGGPFDAYAAALANRAAGNPDDAPLLECVLVAPRLRAQTSIRAAFCDGLGNVQTFMLHAGDNLDLGRFHGGLRGYLAIENGVDERRARYAEAPVVLRAGETLRAPVIAAPEGDRAHVAESPRRDRNVIRIVPGPHDAPALAEDWKVTAQLNRVGIRLRPIVSSAFEPSATLPSCGMQFGTLQWHPDGSLVAIGPDHPVTGGYLQPATIVSEDLWKLAQLGPGEHVRLVAV